MEATPIVIPGFQDILYHILSYLTPDLRVPSIFLDEPADSKSARKALACLARAHSIFTQPALAVMWRSLPSQEPLEHLLCVLGLAQRPIRPPEQRDRPPLEICRTPAAHAPGWIRFREHASLVREIILDPFVDHSGIPATLLEDTFWCQLCLAFGDTPILPHLQRATLRSRNSRSPIDMGLFRLLNPSIRELDVNFPQTARGDLKRLKTALTRSFLSIERLEVHLLGLGLVLDMESLPRLHPRLRYLKLNHCGGFIELDHLRALATLPDLEHLTFRMHSCEVPKLPVTFTELRSLSVSCHRFGVVAALIAHVDAPRLQIFSISETHEHSDNIATSFPNHLRTLLAKCPSLTVFEWTSTQGCAWKTGSCGAPLSDLVGPLLSQRAMRSFSVDLHGPIVPYTPADFRVFVEAWPDLEAFHLRDTESYHAWDGVEQHADVASVVAFARHCPRLRSLDIARVRLQLDSSASLDSVHPLPAGARHWLRELGVDHVVLPPAGEEDGCHRESFVGRFRSLVERIFPYAIIRV